jgi:hypothetical protein
MVVVDAFNNQHSVRHVLISEKDEDELTIVDEISLFVYRHYVHNDGPLVVRQVYDHGTEPVWRAVNRWLRNGGEILELERREAFIVTYLGLTFLTGHPIYAVW